MKNELLSDRHQLVALARAWWHWYYKQWLRTCYKIGCKVAMYDYKIFVFLLFHQWVKWLLVWSCPFP